MFFYWFLYCLVTLVSLTSIEKSKILNQFFWISLLTIIVFTIGFRENIGGDWYAYLDWFEQSAKKNLFDTLVLSDIGYMAINWVVAQLGGDIELVNLACGALFIIGLAKFCSSLPSPWIALACSIPYVIIVIAMGYTRQSVALGFLFYALPSLRCKAYLRYIFIIFLGSLFHKTVLAMLLPLIFEIRKKLSFLSWLLIFGTSALLLLVFIDYCQRKWNAYVVADMQSAGALFRALMASFPVLLSILYRKQIWENIENRDFWRSIAFAILVSPILALLSSTATDRLLIYTFPLQLLCWSQLACICSTQNKRFTATTCILFYHGATLYIWLNFAVNSHYWVPYQNILF